MVDNALSKFTVYWHCFVMEGKPAHAVSIYYPKQKRKSLKKRNMDFYQLLSSHTFSTIIYLLLSEIVCTSLAKFQQGY